MRNWKWELKYPSISPGHTFIQSGSIPVFMSDKVLIPNRSNAVTFMSVVGALFLGAVIGVIMVRTATASMLAQIMGFVLFPLCYWAGVWVWTTIGALWEVKEKGVKGMVEDTKAVFQEAMSVAKGEKEFVEKQDYLRPGGSAFVSLYVLVAAAFGFLVAMFSKSAEILPTCPVFGIVGFAVGFGMYWLVRLGYVDLWGDSEDPLFEEKRKGANPPPPTS